MPRLWVALGAVVALVLAGCSAEGDHRADSATRVRALSAQLASVRAGIAIRYPTAWNAALVGPEDAFVIASFPLPNARRLDFPLDRIRRALPPNGVLVYLFQYRGLLANPAARKQFPPRPARFGLEEKDFGSYEGWGRAYLLKFRERGHAVQIMVVLGEDVSGKTRAALLEVLDSLRLEPRTVRLRTIGIPGAPRELAVGLGAVWVAAERSDAAGAAILRIHPKTRRVVAAIRAPGKSVVAGLAVGAGAVWATDLALGQVLRIDPATNRIVARIPLPTAPFRPFAIAVGEGAVWVTVPTNVKGAVVRIDPKTNKAAERPIEVGYGPNAIAVGAGGVWVTNTNVAGGSLMRIDPKRGRVVAKLRLDGLGASASEVVRIVAALAEPTSALVQAAAGSRAERGLAEALEAGVLALEGDRLRFSHPLLGSAASSRLTPSGRRSLHARLAELVPGAEERARQLALAAAGPSREAAAALEEAAQAAHVRGAPAAAAELAEQAVQLTPDSNAEDRRRRIIFAADRLDGVGDSRGAVGLLEQARDAALAGPARAAVLVRLALPTTISKVA
jgi:hypothetical protein